MSALSPSVPFTPSSALPKRPENAAPLPSLPVLVAALSGQPELDIITSTVQRYVARRHAYYLSTDVRPRRQSQLMPSSFEVATLFQALAWERLDELEEAVLSPDGFRVMRDQILDTPAAKALAMELHNALGWDQNIIARLAEPQLLKQLVWSALIFEIEPPSSRKPGHIAGYDLATHKNRGQSYSRLRENIVDHLQWQTRTVEGSRSSRAARLALAILEPLHPEFAIRDVPKDLKYGTLRWVNFAHGVALAEALQPGTSSRQTFEQLTDLPLERSDNASAEALQTIAATRLMPTIHWAIAHGVITHRQDAEYSETDLGEAVRALDEHSDQLARAMQAVLREPPNRISMADQQFRALVGDEYYHLGELVMFPTSVGKRIELATRNPSVYDADFRFYLQDLFAAGFMKNGLDLFEPDFGKSTFHLDRSVILRTIEKLKGVDIPARFDAAFKTYFDEARAGYALLIESLFEQLPVADRICLNEGEVSVYVLREETGKTVKDETAQDRADVMGRFGFIIQCSHEGALFSYEFFPFRAQLIRRVDLPVLKVPATYAQRPLGSRNISQTGTAARVDWQAYNKNEAPREGVVSDIIAMELGRYEPEPTRKAQPLRTLCSSRLKHIAELISQRNMFCDYSRAHSFYRGKTGSELVSENYPPVLRVLEVLVPGLSCFNAVQNNESPAPTCILDVGSSILGLPLFQLFRGSLKVVAHAGQIRSIHTFPRFAQWMGKSGSIAPTNASAFFRMPQRVNGRIGYPLSGRGAGSSRARSLSPRKLDNVEEFDEVVAQTDIFRSNEQIRLDMRANLAEGAEIRVHVRRDGTRTLIRKDTNDGTYIDLSNNETVSVISHYDYRVLRSWAVNEAAHPTVTRLPLRQIESTRTALVPERLASVREAIETGTYLLPLDVRKAGTGYTVINGNHRVQAALDLGLDEVPVIIETSAH